MKVVSFKNAKKKFVNIVEIILITLAVVLLGTFIMNVVGDKVKTAAAAIEVEPFDGGSPGTIDGPEDGSQ